MSQTSLRLRVVPRYPASVTATDGIKAVRSGVDLVVKSDYSNLVQVADVPNPDKTFMLAWDSDIDNYQSMSFTNIINNIQDAVIGPPLAAIDATNPGTDQVVYFTGEGEAATYTASEFVRGISNAPDAGSFADSFGAMSASVYDPDSVGEEVAFKSMTATAEQGALAVSAMQPATYDPSGIGADAFQSSNTKFKNGAGPSITRSVADRLAEYASVLDFGAIADGVTDCLTAFNNAAAFVGSWGCVYVPAGNWYLSGATTGNAFWRLDARAKIIGLPDQPIGSGSLINDTSRLTGQIDNQHVGNTSATGRRFGDPELWLTTLYRPTAENIAGLASVSPRGSIAGLFATRVSDAVANSTSQAASFTCVNDDAVNGYGGWGLYGEQIKTATATGTLFSTETDFINLAATVTTDPYQIKSGMTAHHWMSCGGGSNPLAPGANDLTMAMGILPNTKGFRTGITFFNGSITGSSLDAIASPYTYAWGWYDAASSRRSSLDGRAHQRTISNDTAATGIYDLSQRRRTAGATASSDIVYRHDMNAFNGTAYFQAGFDQTIQATSYDGNSRARFGRLMSQNNGDGTSCVITINYLAANHFGPQSDGLVNLGLASARWNTVYASTGTINTSDGREKTDPLPIDDAVLDAWGDVSFVTFRWLSSIAEKGENKARWHFGVIAQQVRDAFAARGLDGTRYGLLCYDRWDEEKAPVYETIEKTIQHEAQGLNKETGQPYAFTIDEVITEQVATGEETVRQEGNRWGIRPDQCLFLEAAFQRRRSDRIEQRLAALEGNRLA